MDLKFYFNFSLIVLSLLHKFNFAQNENEELTDPFEDSDSNSESEEQQSTIRMLDSFTELLQEQSTITNNIEFNITTGHQNETYERNTTELLYRTINPEMSTPNNDLNLNLDVLKFRILPKMLSLAMDIDPVCVNQIKIVVNGLKNEEVWAIHMIDASAKMSSGIMVGHIPNLGNFDECLEIKNNVTQSQRVLGKHCVSHLTVGPQMHKYMDDFISHSRKKFQNTLNFTVDKISAFDHFLDSNSVIGFCVPNLCSADDLNKISQNILKEFGSDSYFHFKDKECQTAERSNLSTFNIICLATLSVVLFINLISTLYDTCTSKESVNKIFTSFSLYQNIQTITTSKHNKSDITCLNGLRVLSMMWIIYAHKFLNILYGPVTNGLDVIKWMNSITFATVYTGVYAVDTFFVVSGFLIAYLYLRRSDENTNTGICFMIFQRFLRLTPALMVAIAADMNRSQIFNGPLLQKYVYDKQEACEKNWWSTLFYFSNFEEPFTTCLWVSWYLGVDTHLYLVSPLLLIGFKKMPKLTIPVLILAISGSVILNMYITYVHVVLPLLLNDNSSTYRIYYYTHTRMGPWILGLLFGFIVYKQSHTCEKLSKYKVFAMWFYILTTLFGLFFYIYLRLIPYDITSHENAFLNGVSRNLWALAICFLIYVCRSGYGGIVNKFLSSTPFTLTYKVNYGMFLCHMFVIDFFSARQRTVPYFDYIITIKSLISDYIFTFIAAALLTVTVEMPFYNLGKIIYGKLTLPKKNVISDDSKSTSTVFASNIEMFTHKVAE